MSVKTAQRLARAVPDPSPAIQAAHSELPIPQAPQWAGYWNFVTGAIIVMFILFVAKKGDLKTWIGFFSWSTPAPIASSGSASAGTASTAANPNVGTVVGAGNGQPGLNLNNPFAGIPGIGGVFQSILPGNSNGSGTQAVPGQANPIPWAQIFKGL